MKTRSLVALAVLALALLGVLHGNVLPTAASAISTGISGGADDSPSACTIHVDTEEGGNIDVVANGGLPDGVDENANGAIFWNGARWVTNDTAAHMYYTCLETGQRIKNYTVLATLDGSGSPGVVFAQSGFTVTQSIYNYSVGAADFGGIFSYQAVDYSIDTSRPHERIIVRSRGTGNGTSQGYLDIYIQENYTDTIAFRGDPVWFHYANTTAQQATLITSDTQGRFGYLPTYTPSARARYWIDSNGGSDMGGMTYFFRTSQITADRTRNLGSSYATEFRIKFVDGASQLVEFIVLPRLISETFEPAQNIQLYLPFVVKR